MFYLKTNCRPSVFHTALESYFYFTQVISCFRIQGVFHEAAHNVTTADEGRAAQNDPERALQHVKMAVTTHSGSSINKDIQKVVFPNRNMVKWTDKNTRRQVERGLVEIQG